MNTFRQTDIKRSYECWFTLDFRKLTAKNVKFWQIPRLFRGNLQIPRKIVNSAENTKIHDFFRDSAILEGLTNSSKYYMDDIDFFLTEIITMPMDFQTH